MSLSNRDHLEILAVILSDVKRTALAVYVCEADSFLLLTVCVIVSPVGVF